MDNVSYSTLHESNVMCLYIYEMVSYVYMFMSTAACFPQLPWRACKSSLQHSELIVPLISNHILLLQIYSDVGIPLSFEIFEPYKCTRRTSSTGLRQSAEMIFHLSSKQSLKPLPCSQLSPAGYPVLTKYGLGAPLRATGFPHTIMPYKV